MAAAKPTIVLVPGGWHTIEYFGPFRHSLESYGYSTEAVTLPSVGAEPVVQSYDEDVAAIQDVFLRLVNEGKGIVLITHSYSGLPGSDAVEGFSRAKRAKEGLRGGVEALIYASAWVVTVGLNLVDFVGAHFGPHIEADPWIEVGESGKSYVKDARNIMYNAVRDEQEALMWTEKLRHHSIPSLMSKSKHAPYKDIDTVYVICKDDHALLPPRQEKVIGLAGIKKWVKLHADHSPFLTATQGLTHVVRAVAGENVVLRKGEGILPEDIGSEMTNLRVERE